MGIEFPYDELGDSPDTQLFRAARELMSAGEYLEAIPIFEASMMLAPHFKTAECVGECYFKLGRLTEAVIPLAAATALNTGQRAPKLLAEVFLELDELEQARSMAELALRRLPHYKVAAALLETINELINDVATDD